MYMRRHIVRERTMFAIYDALLFESLNLDFDPKQVLCGTFMCKLKDIDPSYVTVFTQALLNQKEIAAKVDEFLKNWSFQRLSWISKAVFLLSYTETVILNIVPKEISINEAIELTKEYVSPAETKYLNAVLNKVLSKALGQPYEKEQISVKEEELAAPSEEEIQKIKSPDAVKVETEVAKDSSSNEEDSSLKAKENV